MERRAFEVGADPVAIEPDALTREWPRAAIFAVTESGDSEMRAKPYAQDGTTAIVMVDGPLMQNAFWFDGYDAICARFCETLADSSVERVVLKISSPGGMVAGMFDAVKTMREAATAAKKPVIAYADEQACSAAYAIACVADQIVVPETGTVGSVGVIATMGSAAERNKNEGLDIRLVTSGAEKADGNPSQPIRDEAVARMQARVDTLAGMFASWVSSRRGMTPDAVMTLEGGVRMGRAAVAAGLADRVDSLGNLLASMRSAAPAPMQNTRLQADSSAVAATGGRPHAAHGVRKMNPALLALLGLKADASDEEIAAAVSENARGIGNVAAITGTNDPAKQQGALAALRAKADEADKLRAEKIEREKTEAETRVAVLTARLDAAVASGRVPPARKGLFEALAPDSLEAALVAVEGTASIVNQVASTAESGTIRAAAANSADGEVAKQMGLRVEKMNALRAQHTPGAVERPLASVHDLSKTADGGVR